MGLVEWMKQWIRSSSLLATNLTTVETAIIFEHYYMLIVAIANKHKKTWSLGSLKPGLEAGYFPTYKARLHWLKTEKMRLSIIFKKQKQLIFTKGRCLKNFDRT